MLFAERVQQREADAEAEHQCSGDEAKADASHAETARRSCKRVLNCGLPQIRSPAPVMKSQVLGGLQGGEDRGNKTAKKSLQLKKIEVNFKSMKESKKAAHSYIINSTMLTCMQNEQHVPVILSTSAFGVAPSKLRWTPEQLLRASAICFGSDRFASISARFSPLYSTSFAPVSFSHMCLAVQLDLLAKLR